MKKSIAVCLLLATACFSGCSMFGNGGEESQQPETIVVKETVIVTETVYVTEPNNAEETEQTTTKDNTSEDDENKGYTTQVVLKKASEASDNQYWVVYFGEGSLRMSTFNALENFTLKWTSDGELVCDKLVGNSIIKNWDSDKSTFSGKNERTDVAFRASEIVGSNCDVYDEKNDKTISAKTE